MARFVSTAVSLSTFSFPALEIWRARACVCVCVVVVVVVVVGGGGGVGVYGARAIKNHCVCKFISKHRFREP